MGNLTTVKEIPQWIMTPHLTQSQTPQQRSRHRAWIGVKAEAALHGYWKSEPSAPIKAEIMRDWMEGLENYYEIEIRDAFKKHLTTNPKIKPNVGYIVAAIGVARNLQKMAHPEHITANNIKSGHSWMCRNISSSAARAAVDMGLVTMDECKKAGVAL